MIFFQLSNPKGSLSYIPRDSTYSEKNEKQLLNNRSEPRFQQNKISTFLEGGGARKEEGGKREEEGGRKEEGGRREGGGRKEEEGGKRDEGEWKRLDDGIGKREEGDKRREGSVSVGLRNDDQPSNKLTKLKRNVNKSRDSANLAWEGGEVEMESDERRVVYENRQSENPFLNRIGINKF